MKLSQAMVRAQKKLVVFDGEWVSAIDLKESLATLDALVSRGVAQRERRPGWFHWPRDFQMYRLARKESERSE